MTERVWVEYVGYNSLGERKQPVSDTLTTIQKAQVLLDDDSPAGFPAYSLAPCADESVAHADHDGASNYIIVARAPGTTTYTVTRTADGATATGTVIVTAVDDTFAVHLGTPVPR